MNLRRSWIHNCPSTSWISHQKTHVFNGSWSLKSEKPTEEASPQFHGLSFVNQCDKVHPLCHLWPQEKRAWWLTAQGTKDPCKSFLFLETWLDWCFFQLPRRSMFGQNSVQYSGSKGLQVKINQCRLTFPIPFQFILVHDLHWAQTKSIKSIKINNSITIPSSWGKETTSNIQSKKTRCSHSKQSHRIHGTGIFTYIWMIVYGFHVGKYTIITWILWEFETNHPPPNLIHLLL